MHYNVVVKVKATSPSVIDVDAVCVLTELLKPLQTYFKPTLNLLQTYFKPVQTY